MLRVGRKVEVGEAGAGVEVVVVVVEEEEEAAAAWLVACRAEEDQEQSGSPRTANGQVLQPCT